MKHITYLGNNIYHILSEPGDATRYDYFCYEDYDDYSFMPAGSDFRFPQRLNFWKIQSIEAEELIKLSQEVNCNPYTLKECIRTINELRSK